MPVPSSERLDDFFATLAPCIKGDFRRDAVTRVLYATDASMYQVMPLGVLLPRYPGDVQAALETARRFDIPVLPRGGGSSLAGQTVSTALVIDTSRHLDQIFEVNPEEKWARVAPGVVLDDLNAALASHGLRVGPDPASSSRATLGGMLGNNATGTHSIRYGNFIHHVRRVKGFLMDGTPFDFGPLSEEKWQDRARSSRFSGVTQEAKGAEAPTTNGEYAIYRALDALLKEEEVIIRRDTPKHWRRNTGYRLEYLLEGDRHAGPGAQWMTHGRNLAHLLCGSEGTLAVATEITVSLVERPARTALGVVHFATRDEALRAVTGILETDPSAVELFDGVAIEAARKAPGFAQRLGFIEGTPGAVLITEYDGASEAELTDKLDPLDHIQEGRTVVHATTPEEIENVWTVRKEGLGLIMGMEGDYKPVALIEDASVPVEHLADYIDALSAFIDETGTRTAYYAHASAGCLHVRPFINTKSAAEVDKMKAIAEASMALVRKYGGAVSSEHGEGRARGWLSEGLVGTDLTRVYRRVKDLFDPDGLLNPGVIIDPPPMERDLRMGPAYRARPVPTKMDFSKEGGFAGAVELCNGNGACRKLRAGTMCPSFMATREEEDSTRGRANALRSALSGDLPPEEFTSERMYEVMDLCVQCKGCKTECPSGVDMAKIKTEWLSTYWEANRMPLRTKLFARMPELSRRLAGTPLAHAANWVNRQPPVKKMMDRTLGISAERSLPAFAPKTFHQWFKHRSAKIQNPKSSARPVPTGTPIQNRAVLFVDTFTDGHVPEVGQAAVVFFERVGCAVEVPTANVCCGRTLLSKGLVSAARRRALQVVEALYPYAAEGVPLVGLEPSCILTLVDELPALLPDDPRAEHVAAHALTFTQFVDRLASEGQLDGVQWTEAPRSVLLHGHCHQKALVGTGAAERALSLPPHYRVETLDTSCCGMAGAFGYEKEHVAVSKKMAERRLAPAVREAAEDTIIAAPGFSCRSQIKDTADRLALHPAQILRDALA